MRTATAGMVTATGTITTTIATNSLARRKRSGAPTGLRPASLFQLAKGSVRRDQVLVGKNGCEPSRLFMIVHHHNGNHAQRLLAGMADGHFTLQVLHKSVREMVQRSLAPGILLVPRAAVRTDEFHLVLLRIAVQSSPPGAAYANRFCVTPVHGTNLLGIHVLSA